MSSVQPPTERFLLGTPAWSPARLLGLLPPRTVRSGGGPWVAGGFHPGSGEKLFSFSFPFGCLALDGRPSRFQGRHRWGQPCGVLILQAFWAFYDLNSVIVLFTHPQEQETCTHVDLGRRFVGENLVPTFSRVCTEPASSSSCSRQHLPGRFTWQTVGFWGQWVSVRWDPGRLFSSFACPQTTLRSWLCSTGQQLRVSSGRVPGRRGATSAGVQGSKWEQGGTSNSE